MLSLLVFVAKLALITFVAFPHQPHLCIHLPSTFAWSIVIATFALLSIQLLIPLDLALSAPDPAFCSRTEAPGSALSLIIPIALRLASDRYTPS
jgi:hypothetical protein